MMGASSRDWWKYFHVWSFWNASLFRTLENMVNKCICFDLQLILVVSSLHWNPMELTVKNTTVPTWRVPFNYRTLWKQGNGLLIRQIHLMNNVVNSSRYVSLLRLWARDDDANRCGINKRKKYAWTGTSCGQVNYPPPCQQDKIAN